MKGYKIAFHDEYKLGTNVLNRLHYECTITRIPVLIVLDIPDDASRSTPENRYTEENMSIVRDRRDALSMPFYAYAEAADVLRDSDAYFTYKDEDPITIYNEFINEEYNRELSKYVHSVKCRCREAKVIDIVGIFNGVHYTHAVSTFDPYFIYELYKTVSCEDFDTYSRMAVCVPGIHYFEYPVFAILYMLETMPSLVDPVCDGKIDSEVADRYLTEELNTLKREDKAVEYCKADVAIIKKLFEEFGKDETNEK